MGIFDAILGRSRPPAADLDALFAVPQAVLSLQTHGHTPSGSGSVCFRAHEGAAFATALREITAILGAGEEAAVEQTVDDHGFTWIVVSAPGREVPTLITDLHAVNAGLSDAGFGSALLCTVVDLTAPDGTAWGLVYLYKRGTFYPFVPRTDRSRDNDLELQIRAIVDGDVTVESDLGRWLALWGAPGLGGA